MLYGKAVTGPISWRDLVAAPTTQSSGRSAWDDCPVLATRDITKLGGTIRRSLLLLSAPSLVGNLSDGSQQFG